MRIAAVSDIHANLPALDAVLTSLILCGHTHVPRLVAAGSCSVVVNPGSVGLQAYDDVHPHPHLIEVGSPHARWALASDERGQGWDVQLRAVAYDHEASAKRAERNGRADWAHWLRTGRVRA
jgi:hypothetical protein